MLTGDMETIGVLMTCLPPHPYLVEQLEKRFTLHKLHLIPDKAQFFSTHRAAIRAVVGNSTAGADAELIDQLPNLEIVSSFSVGLDKIDLAKCKERGIRVTNTPDVLTDDVADLAIGLMLAVLRRLCESDRYVRSGLWKKGDYKLTTKFTGKRVGIIGLGRIGMAIAKRAEAFNCPISYFARTEKTDVPYKYHPSVTELAANCDILVVACALTQETRHIVNREVLDALGPKGVLINIGRGPHVDEPELVAALVEGRLGGAGIDVFENEPHVPEELFGLENVVLLPHVGSGTEETRKEMADLVLGNLEAHFLNKPLLTPVVSLDDLSSVHAPGATTRGPLQDLQPSKPEFLKTHGQDIRAVVCNPVVGVYAQLIDLLPNLEIVATCSVGVDKIDLSKCEEKGIKVTNTPDVLTDEVAELEVGLELSVFRKICACDGYVRSGRWKKDGDVALTTKLTGKTVGIVGLGWIGSAIAKESSVVVFHLSSKRETRHIVGYKVIDALGPKGILINIGRGAHIDEPALVSALLQGRVGGAGLDAYENEPQIPKELFGLDNVVLSPHVGSDTVQTSTAMGDLAVANLEAHFNKKPLLTPVVFIRKHSQPNNMNPKGVLMTSPLFTYLEQELEARFNIFKLFHQPSKPEFLKTHQQDIRAVVCDPAFGVDAQLIDQLPNLEIVATCSVGVDRIDLSKCEEKGIRVTNTPDVLTDDVADLAVGLMLSVLRKICACDGYVRGGRWKKDGDFALTTKLTGKTVGIVGLGRIGSAIAKRAAAFSCPISYHSRSEKPNSNYKYYSNIIDLARNSEILVVACSLTEETRHIISDKVIDALGPKGILINIGRGAHIDEPALVSALLQGRLGGAGLDVYENEPEVPKELFRLDNVVLLPHVGSDTIETSNAMGDLVIANLEAHFNKQPLLTPVLGS
ncbi:hypothetical protein Tsubulata_043711 [Turnera subulata]|uniref:glyoxylate reductase (NADP(+)) n=1 Tax=Turnera subulata TaxID=218843 RepID=A0A9Q0FK22_9ROSI|nr:hypothetical protein Tsubulata_043711 [Turnera subulata]